jgi:hypothetical protein
MDLARLEVEIDPLQRGHAWIGLGDRLKREKVRGGLVHVCLSSPCVFL